jgi:hypothetical protein
MSESVNLFVNRPYAKAIEAAKLRAALSASTSHQVNFDSN